MKVSGLSSTNMGLRTPETWRAYAGICYYKMGDTEGARFIEIFQRKGPNGNSGGYRLDRWCYVNMGNTKEGNQLFRESR